MLNVVANYTNRKSFFVKQKDSFSFEYSKMTILAHNYFPSRSVLDKLILVGYRL